MTKKQREILQTIDLACRTHSLEFSMQYAADVCRVEYGDVCDALYAEHLEEMKGK